MPTTASIAAVGAGVMAAAVLLCAIGMATADEVGAAVWDAAVAELGGL